MRNACPELQGSVPAYRSTLAKAQAEAAAALAAAEEDKHAAVSKAEMEGRVAVEAAVQKARGRCRGTLALARGRQHVTRDRQEMAFAAQKLIWMCCPVVFLSLSM